MAYIPNNNGDEENKDKSVYKQLFNASTVGMALVSGMLVGGAIGYFLDKWLGTSPWLLFIFLIWNLFRMWNNSACYLLTVEDIIFHYSQ